MPGPEALEGGADGAAVTASALGGGVTVPAGAADTGNAADVGGGGFAASPLTKPSREGWRCVTYTIPPITPTTRSAAAASATARAWFRRTVARKAAGPVAERSVPVVPNATGGTGALGEPSGTSGGNGMLAALAGGAAAGAKLGLALANGGGGVATPPPAIDGVGARLGELPELLRPGT